MRINRKKKECANAPIGSFTMFSHCVYGYNIRNELVYSHRYEMHRRSSASEGRFGVAEPEGCASICEGAENQYDDIGNHSTNSSTPNSSTPSLISMSYDRMGRRVTKNNQRFVYDGYLCIGKIEDSTSIHYHLFTVLSGIQPSQLRLARLHGLSSVALAKEDTTHTTVTRTLAKSLLLTALFPRTTSTLHSVPLSPNAAHLPRSVLGVSPANTQRTTLRLYTTTIGITSR